MILSEKVKYRGKLVPVSKLSKNSTIKVKVQCPICNEIREVMYRSICNAGHYICLPCIRLIKQGKALNKGEVYGRLTVIENTPKESLVKCECGNIKYADNYNLKSGKTKSCGCLRVENMAKVRVELKGKNHGRWNNNSSTERERFMQTKQYKTWRTDVFNRDDYKCVVCGQVGYDLVAHHIENYSENKELRTSIDNGVTMCNDCHIDFHKQYGYSGNNLTQLREVKNDRKTECTEQFIEV